MDCITKQAAPILPVEIMYNILLFISPNELFPLRTVSKEFRAIIDDPVLWRTMYADAHLPRPPGPFSWQSTRFLQHTLVQSARLAQCWTSQPISVISTHLLRAPPESDSIVWVCGRWLITCVEMRRVVSYDLDTHSEQLLCQSDDEWVSWSATSSLMSTRGHLVYVGLCTKNSHSGDRMKLLEFQADDDSGHLSGPITSNIPLSCTDRDARLHVKSGDTPFVLISVIPSQSRWTRSLMFDTRSQIFYKFPKLGYDANGPILGVMGQQIVLTMTHIILYRTSSSPSDPFQLIQAYVIPDNNETHELRLSYETSPDVCGFSSWVPPPFFLLRNSVTDPITGSTHTRILHMRQSNLLCTDITLLANSTADVLPISIHTHYHAVFTDDECSSITNIFQSSTDGFARGLCASITSAKLLIRKVTIDGTGETCVGVVGDVYPLPTDATHMLIGPFDGLRGRILLTTGSEREVVVLDMEKELLLILKDLSLPSSGVCVCANGT
ncbi:hypothetical protein OG21DRAFT_1500760 [Imleria badia]|nr:hypothetical protein OG21DRAFT_1500760 [Imleria badia]